MQIFVKKSPHTHPLKAESIDPDKKFIDIKEYKRKKH